MASLTHFVRTGSVRDSRSASSNVGPGGTLTFPTIHPIPGSRSVASFLTYVSEGLMSVSESVENYAQVSLRNRPQVMMSK